MAYPAMDVYLNDHLAGATAGLKLAQLAAEEHRSDELAGFFSNLAADIEEDYDLLERLLEDMAVDKSATKSALAEIGSKLVEPKFTGASADDPDLGLLVTLEALSIGVEGKLCMWKALMRVTDAYPALAALDLDSLAERAESQRQVIEDKRLEVAPRALAHTVNA